MGKQTWKAGNMLNPVPAVMVSCQDKKGNTNIITVAWAGTICTNPPMLSISVRPERHSYHMIEETGEFVVNLTTKDLVYACDYCGVTSGREVDKFRASSDESTYGLCKLSGNWRKSCEYPMQSGGEKGVGQSSYVYSGNLRGDRRGFPYG